MKNRLLISLFLLVGLMTSEAQAVWIWTPQTRRFVNPKSASKDTPHAQIDWAVGFLEAKDYARASREFLKLVQTFPRSELAPEAQYLVGVCYEMMDKQGEAFNAYKKLVEIYPFSSRFKEAIEREFAIAENLFEGGRLRIVGLIKVPSIDKAIEIYEHILAHAPFGDYGAKAQFRLGECYRKQERFEEASRAFQKMVEQYPSSPLVEEAKFNIAFCAYHLSLKPSYDQSATDEAITWYESFISAHPENPMVPEAKESLRKLREFKAEGLAQTAAFYEQQGKQESAVIYYKQIADSYSDSSKGPEAVAKIAEWSAKDKADKGPQS